ncbi:hypothetical protein Golob_010008 [Gossypium lobatum]|uniref:Uncharacterized protein n=1 Tax=Gossypium lobatum TaxID=34289 RepID=A0A7J8MKG9_9ROSI|nr:hypothetical protein [Gossypium lobatum]
MRSFGSIPQTSIVLLISRHLPLSRETISVAKNST